MANSNLKSNVSIKCNKPMLLKDFLNDDSTNDFGSYPQKPCKQNTKNQDLIVFKRSKSSRTTTSTILAIHKASEIVIKTLKHFPFSSINKAQTILPRSISSKLLSRSIRRDKNDNQRENTEAKVKVKDILRWRSSRDLVVEESTPLDLCYSSGSTSCSSPLTSKSSSWCESDFSAEDFPSWCYASEDGYGASETKTATTLLEKSPKRTVKTVVSLSYRAINDRKMTESSVDEKQIMDEIEEEQYTPVSVLASPFQENREFNNICRFENNRSLSQITEFKEHAKQLDETEEKAESLLHLLKQKTIPNSYDSFMQDNLLMDFFWEELSTHSNGKNDELLERKLLATAEDWLRGENKRENYVNEMEKGLKWNKHEEEKEDMVLELEKLVLNSLVDEALFDLITL